MRAREGDSFAALLRRHRQAAGLSQEELSALSGLSARAIGFMEAGTTVRPYRRSLLLLIEALALSEADGAALMRAAGRGRTAAASVGDAEPAGLPAPGDPVAEGAAVPRPAELPPDVAEFTGRSDEIRQLASLLGGASLDRPPAIAVITGGGGLGKSALAVHVAHRLRGDFSDGQLFVELRGSGDQPVSSADALARLLRQLGVADAAVPADAAERVAAYRTRVADRRMLLVLDDARDAAQVRPLLPGTASNAVLVTSRGWLPDLDGCQRLALSPLDNTDALALFTHICGADRVAAELEATRAVLVACAGLPLAVRIAAARLVSRPRWKIGALADRLADQLQRLEELAVGDLAVRASFQVSYLTLNAPGPVGAGVGQGIAGMASDDSARAFRLLGLWPGPDLGLPAAAALLGVDSITAFRALERLVDIHMLEGLAERRYRFHDLIGAFALECARRDEEPAACEAAIGRVLSWYLHTAHEALIRLDLRSRRHFELAQVDAGVHPLAFADRGAAAQWTDDERANIATAVMLASRMGLHEVCAQLATVVWRCQLRSPWDGWTSVLDHGIASAATAGDAVARAWLLNYQGIVLMYHGRTEEAMACLTQALPLSRAAADLRCEVALTGNLAIACKELKRYDEAIAYFERTERIDPDPDPRRTGTTLMNLGMLQIEVGRVEEGARSLERALAGITDLGDHWGDALGRALLADAYRRLGNYGDAIASAQRALEISTSTKDKYASSAALRALGMAHADTGDDDQARAYLASAHALSHDLGLPETEQIAAAIAALGQDDSHQA